MTAPQRHCADGRRQHFNNDMALLPNASELEKGQWEYRENRLSLVWSERSVDKIKVGTDRYG